MRTYGSGTIEERGGRWYARLPPSHGRKRLGPFETRREAESVLAAALEELVAAPARTPTTVDEWGLTWLDARERSGHYRSIRRDRARWAQHVTRSWLGSVPLDSLEAADVRRWVAGLRPARSESLSPTTRRHALAMLHACMRAAVEAEHIRTNPCTAVRLPRAAARTSASSEQWEWLRRAELERVVALASGQQRAIVEVAAFTGLRAGELWALRWSAVESERGVLRVECAFGEDGRIGPPKSGRSREVPILPRVARALKAQSARTSERTLVFSGPKGGYTTGYDAGFPALRRSAGIERGVRFHDLRHTFASLAIQGELVDEGLPAMRLEDLRQWLGHADVATTQRYSHLAPDGLRRLVSVPESAPPRAENGSHLRELNPRPTVYETGPEGAGSAADAWAVGQMWADRIDAALEAYAEGSPTAHARAIDLLGEMRRRADSSVRVSLDAWRM